MWRKLLFSILFFALFSQTLYSQTDTTKTPSVTLNLGADLASRYVWRGTQFGGNGPSFQPGLSVAWKGLELGFWGAFSLDGINTMQELDLNLKYTFLKDMVSIGLTDYYFPNEAGGVDPFDYRKDYTTHILEGMASFNGTKSLPISLLFSMNFYGNDAAKIEKDPASADFNKKVGIQYSSYLELGYAASIQNYSLNLFAGANLNTPQKVDSLIGYSGESGFYGSKAGLVNLGFTLGKTIEVTEKFSLPISASVIVNPTDKRYFLVFVMSI